HTFMPMVCFSPSMNLLGGRLRGNFLLPFRNSKTILARYNLSSASTPSVQIKFAKNSTSRFEIAESISDLSTHSPSRANLRMAILDERHDMRAPRLKGCSLLGIKAVTLIDANYART